MWLIRDRMARYRSLNLDIWHLFGRKMKHSSEKNRKKQPWSSTLKGKTPPWRACRKNFLDDYLYLSEVILLCSPPPIFPFFSFHCTSINRQSTSIIINLLSISAESITGQWASSIVKRYQDVMFIAKHGALFMFRQQQTCMGILWGNWETCRNKVQERCYKVY